MLPSRGSTRCLRAAGSGTDSRLPRWRFTNDRRPRLLTLPSIVRPPLSRFSVFSLFHSCLVLSGRSAAGLSGAGSLRSAPVGRANMLPSRGSTRCLRAAGSGTDSRLPRRRFTNDRRPRLLTLPSIVRPPLSRFSVFSLFPPVWSCPAARRPVPQWRRFGSIRTCRAGEHAAQPRLNSLPARSRQRNRQRLPRRRFTNDRRPRLLTFPSIVRPPLSRFSVFSSSPPLWSCPAARRPVPQ